MKAPARRDLPAPVRAWVEGLVARAVVDVTAVGGGFTETKWVVRLDDGVVLVVRWSDLQVWGEQGREHVRREAVACRLLAGSGLPVPRLVGSDVDGTIAGGPANVLTWRPGRVRLDRLDSVAIAALARELVAVHRQVVPREERPPAFSFRESSEGHVPEWARWPELWRRALSIRADRPPDTDQGLLHGDCHLSNTLWEGATVSGLIDWAETAWGPPDLDVAHMCSDFAMMHSTSDAEAFRAAYTRHGGRLDPDRDSARYWAVSDILGFLPDPAHILTAVANNRPDLTADALRRGLEDLLAATLA